MHTILWPICFVLQFILLVPTKGQFPAACLYNASRRIPTCCPGPNGCSGNGRCEDISAQASWSTIGIQGGFGRSIVNSLQLASSVDGYSDIRYEWPTRIFTKVCRCNEGYGGAACDECDFGYMNSSSGCQKVSRERIRKNFRHMSQKEKKDLINVLKEAKMEERSNYTWVVVVQEPNASGSIGLERVSTYDLFVYHHYLSNRDGGVVNADGPACKTTRLDLSKVDFAHEGPGFLTWHRYYLLFVERELGRIAERLETTSWDRYTFALPYWDWDDSEAAIADIFSKDHFGTFTKDADRDSVRGVLFNDKGWPTVCDLHYWLNVNYAGSNYNIQLSCGVVRRLCNPNDFRDDRYPLQRGSFRRRGQKLNETDIRALPDRNTIKYLINTAQYDAPCDQAYINRDGYDSTASEDSFRNRVEGFVNLQNPATGQFKNCKKRTYQDHNNFHNAVHIYIHGHMRVVSSASNDPVFFLHHVNVDRIFELWLRGMGANAKYMPTNRIAHPGHNPQDYLVPLFPLKTNEDMYKRSSEFGYSYEEQDLDRAQGAAAGFSVLYPSSFAGILARIALPIVAAVVMNGHHILGG